jgi:hypothetical protein
MPPSSIEIAGVPALPLVELIHAENGYPYVDWSAVHAWYEKIEDPDLQRAAWKACERAWLEHLRAALGPRHRIAESEDAIVLSPASERLSRVKLEFLLRTRSRILKLLDGVAAPPNVGSDILVVFENTDDYYRYVAHYYPDEGEFAFSSGMYVNRGCGHFVMENEDMTVLEPIVAHELTHACVSHLPLPLWLNEGLAVNSEYRLTRVPPPEFSPEELHAMRQKFWTASTIQEFWSGHSFYRPDEGNRLSYDLAKILVEQLAADWDVFRNFATAAHADDAGATAAAEHLGIELGRSVSAILGKNGDWSPNPATWLTEPETTSARASVSNKPRARLSL